MAPEDECLTGVIEQATRRYIHFRSGHHLCPCQGGTQKKGPQGRGLARRYIFSGPGGGSVPRIRSPGPPGSEGAELGTGPRRFPRPGAPLDPGIRPRTVLRRHRMHELRLLHPQPAYKRCRDVRALRGAGLHQLTIPTPKSAP